MLPVTWHHYHHLSSSQSTSVTTTNVDTFLSQPSWSRVCVNVPTSMCSTSETHCYSQSDPLRMPLLWGGCTTSPVTWTRGWVVWLVTQPLVHGCCSNLVHLVCTVFSHQYAAQLAAVGSSDSLWSKLLLQLLAPPPPSLLTPPHTDEWYVGTTSYFIAFFFECAMTKECPLFHRQNLDTVDSKSWPLSLHCYSGLHILA